MRPLRPFCGTVLKAQLLTLPATISTSANGVVTIQLSFLPPASSTATEVFGSSESRPATAQPPEPPPTTTKSYVSVTRIPLASHAFSCSKAGLLRNFWQEWSDGPDFARKMHIFTAIKSRKDRIRAFPNQACVGTYRSHPRALA